MKIHISKSTDKMVGAVRLNADVFDKLEKMSEKNGVSKQEIIRAILDAVIDDIEL